MNMVSRVRSSFAFRLPLPRRLVRLGDLVRVHPFGERIPLPGPSLHAIRCSQAVPHVGLDIVLRPRAQTRAPRFRALNDCLDWRTAVNSTPPSWDPVWTTPCIHQQNSQVDLGFRVPLDGGFSKHCPRFLVVLGGRHFRSHTAARGCSAPARSPGRPVFAALAGLLLKCRSVGKQVHAQRGERVQPGA